MKKLLLIALMVSGITGAFAQTRKVKFSVDMTGQTVSSNGVHVAGNFQNWKPGNTAMTQVGSSNIYTVIDNVDENSVVEFKFINGNDWPDGESIPSFSQKGNSVNGGNNGNRWAFVGAGSDTLDLGAIVFGGTAPAAVTGTVVTGSSVVASNGIMVNSQTVATNYTIATGNNGGSFGPVTVNSGITVTIASGSTWTVV
jgi:hypothetical protein